MEIQNLEISLKNNNLHDLLQIVKENCENIENNIQNINEYEAVIYENIFNKILFEINKIKQTINSKISTENIQIRLYENSRKMYNLFGDEIIRLLQSAKITDYHTNLHHFNNNNSFLYTKNYIFHLVINKQKLEFKIDNTVITVKNNTIYKHNEGKILVGNNNVISFTKNMNFMISNDSIIDDLLLAKLNKNNKIELVDFFSQIINNFEILLD